MAYANKDGVAEISANLLRILNAPVPVIPTCHISKSKYMAGLQCAKREYLQVHQPELAREVDNTNMEQGMQVGLLARDAFPGGALVAADHNSLSDAIRDTRELAANTEVPAIFEGTFEHSGVLVRVDVLKRNAKGFHLTEVKSATKVKPEYTDDVSLQKYVLEGCGVEVERANLMHLSREYVYDGTLGLDGRRVYDLSQLFATEELHPYSESQVSRNLDGQFKILAHPSPPEIEPSDQCDSPYYCEFFEHCHPVWPEDDVRSLPIDNRKMQALRDAGIMQISQLPGLVPLREQFHLNKKECRFALGAKDKGVQITPGLATELHTLQYPLYFMDFETVYPALPLFASLRPYDQLPFQWSVHVQTHPGAEPQHHEFIAMDASDPRYDFIESLLPVLGDRGSVLVYNATFENQRLSELAAHIPQHAPQVQRIQQRLFDLLPVIRNYVYHSAFHGSYSLKYVLPALVTDMTYQGMQVANGEEAGIAWESMVRGKLDTQEREKTRKALLEYCGQDTLALLRLLAFLEQRKV